MKEKKWRLVNAGFIAIFLVIICAPAIQQKFQVIPLEPVVESRAKVPLPPGNPIEQLWLGNGYFPDYERHFNDIFGFRDFFIRLRNQIQYSLFRDSDQVVIGRNGWLADRVAVEVEQRSVDTITPEQWSRLSQRIIHFNHILRQQGIYLLILPIPLKNTVYPELFPGAAARRPATTGYARFVQLLKESHVPFIDAYTILSEKRRSVEVYYRTDMHWNTVGAAAVAAQTIDALGRAMRRNVRWQNRITMGTQTLVGGDEANSLAILWPIRDIEPIAYGPDNDCGQVARKDSTAEPHVGNEFINQCRGSLLPQTMMFGNSYMAQMTAVGFRNYFSRFYPRYDLTEFPKVLTEIKPGTRILIWQLFELEIAYQLQQDAWWQEIDARR